MADDKEKEKSEKEEIIGLWKTIAEKLDQVLSAVQGQPDQKGNQPVEIPVPEPEPEPGPEPEPEPEKKDKTKGFLDWLW